jgi:hypothetical protein
MHGRLLAAALALGLTAPLAAPAAASEPLRLNDLQARGSHNSFHRDPMFPGREGVGWDYSHPTLDRQLHLQGVRQVELDVHYNWARDELQVYHAWFGDDRSTCDLLSECLAVMRRWSDAHPQHHPILVLIEPKDAQLPELPENGDPFTEPFDEESYQRLDETLLAGWGAHRTITPGDVVVEGKSLRDSIRSHGWPLLDDVRGQVLFLIDGDDHGAAYSRSWTSLAGRTAFVQAEPDTAVAAFVGRDGARAPGEDKYGRMRRLVAQNFMVRDYVDPPATAALAAGAQFVSSDHAAEQKLSDDPLAPSRCNPISAPVGCTDRLVETFDKSVPFAYAGPEPVDSYDRAVLDKADRLGCGSARSVTVYAADTDPGCPVG